MIVSEGKVFWLEVSGQILEVMEVCLRMFKKTGDEKWMQDFRFFEDHYHKFLQKTT